MEDNKTRRSSSPTATVDNKAATEANRLGGALIFFIALFAVSGIGSLWLFFGALANIAQGASGTGMAALWESLFGSILIAGGLIGAAVLIGLRKKLGVLVTYIALGLQFIVTTIVAITVMTIQVPSPNYCPGLTYSGACAPSTTGLPASVIVLLVGVIVVSLVENGLIASYFTLSKRVKTTLTA